MYGRSLAPTTMSANGCWKKNMYQLRLIWARLVRNATPTAGPGGTAMVTTLLHVAELAAMWVITAPQS